MARSARRNRTWIVPFGRHDSADDADAVPIPFLLPATTDGRGSLSQGYSYGFTPLLLPDGFEFQKLVHAANERVPASAIATGAEMMFKLLRRYPA